MTEFETTLPVTLGSAYTSGGTSEYSSGAGWWVSLYIEGASRWVLQRFDSSPDVATAAVWAALADAVTEAGGEDNYLRQTLRQIEDQLIKGVEHAEWMVADRGGDLEADRIHALTHGESQVERIARSYSSGLLGSLKEDLREKRQELDTFRARYAEYLMTSTM